MKKIHLNVADLDATEILSRDQLKSIFGGSTSSSGSSSSCNSGCKGKSAGASCYNSNCEVGTCAVTPVSMTLACWR